jgi:uncharacterized protein YidB (DUF937 family)
MGLLDDTLRQLTQGGNVPQPLLVVCRELLLGKPQEGTQTSPSQQQAQAPQANAVPASDGANFGGLGGLLAQLQAAGLGDAVKSWIGSGQNAPVKPEDLGAALGPKNVGTMADKAGVGQDDLLTQLARVLPGLIDKLTADGRVPSQAELAERLKTR